MPLFKLRTSRAHRTWALVFSCVTVFLLAGGYWFYRNELDEMRATNNESLALIAELKAKQIEAWREDRITDARRLVRARNWRRAVPEVVKGAVDKDRSEYIVDRLTLEIKEGGYVEAILIAADGRVLQSVPRPADISDAATQRAIKAALVAPEPVISDLFRGVDSRIYIDTVAAVSDFEGKTVGAVVFRSGAEQTLYPIVKSWPLPSASAEAGLVQRFGDEVLLLTPFRLENVPPLTHRFAIAESDRPAVRAVMGQTGPFLGTDYRNVEVMADLRPIANSPWFLVTKIDADEALRDARDRALVVGLIVGAFILFTGAIAISISRRQQVNLYRSLFESERGRTDAEEVFRATLYSIGDGVISTDTSGKILKMNPVAEQLTGWTEARARGHALAEVFKIIDETTRAPIVDRVAGAIAANSIVRLPEGTVLISRDKTERPIADSAAPIRDKNGVVIGIVIVFLDQTAQRAAKEALRKSEENLAITLQSIGDAVIATDTQGRIVRMNVAAEKLTAWRADDAMGRSLAAVFQVVNSATRKPVVDPVQLVLDSAEVVDLSNHTLLIARDGHEYHIANTAAPIFSVDGSVTGVVLVFSDVTEKYHARQALKDSEEFNISVLDSLSAHIAVLDGQGEIISVNGAWNRFAEANASLLGIGKSVGVNYLAVCERAGRDHEAKEALAARDGINDVLAGRRASFDLEYPCDSPEEKRWFHMYVTPLRGAFHGVVVAHENITARKLAEEKLRDVREGFDLAVLGSAAGTWDWELATGVVRMTARVRELLSYTYEQFPDTIDAWKAVLHPDERDEVIAALEAHLHARKRYSLDFRMLSGTGVYRWFHVSGQALWDAEGRPFRMAGSMTAIDQRKQAEARAVRYTEMLDLMGEVAKIGGWEIDLVTSKVLWSKQVYRIHEVESTFDPSLEDALQFYVPEDRPVIEAAVKEGMENGTPWDLELRMITAKGRRIWVHAQGQVVMEDGKAVRVFGAFHDITHRKSAQERQKLLMRELDHRVKNTLVAIVALSNSTLRESQTLVDFRERFTGRIMAMSQTHQALARNHWAGLKLGSLAPIILAPYNVGGQYATMSGPMVMLPVTATMPVAMILHELATNAVKYGSLSVPEGRVDIVWTLLADGMVEVTWRESGGPSVTPPTREGGGTALIHGLIEYELGGKAEFIFEPTGLTVKLTMQPEAGASVSPA